MKFTYLKTPLNKYTFKSKKIKQWVEEVSVPLVLNLFSGMIKLNIEEIRNDIRKDMVADFHYDALEFVEKWDGKRFNTILLDPPYSYRKSMEMYEGQVMSPFNILKDKLIPILNEDGIVITFGYHSNVMGNKRGFSIEQVLLMSHGGAIHDTIATVEKLIKKNGISHSKKCHH
jgi:hypothetical protein|tara:strand:+ start:3026 stop:3544 length:519 start_codon:yes stop_codon:yes gene_type:complete